MGNMKTFWIFGWERWGGLRPACMFMVDGRKFVPLAFGLWIRRDRRPDNAITRNKAELARLGRLMQEAEKPVLYRKKIQEPCPDCGEPLFASQVAVWCESKDCDYRLMSG